MRALGEHATIRTIDDLSSAGRALLCALRDESARDELATDPDAYMLDEAGTVATLTVDERCHLERTAAGDRGARRAIRAVFALPLDQRIFS